MATTHYQALTQHPLWQGIVVKPAVGASISGCVQVLDRFLESKGKVDSGNAANQEDQENQCIDVFHALTSVRALLASGLQGGEPSR